MTSVPLTFLQRLDLGVTADRRSNPSINPPGLFGVYAEQPFFCLISFRHATSPTGCGACQKRTSCSVQMAVLLLLVVGRNSSPACHGEIFDNCGS
jgi:hypothetical protein